MSPVPQVTDPPASVDDTGMVDHFQRGDPTPSRRPQHRQHLVTLGHSMVIPDRKYLKTTHTQNETAMH
jgi:hypothetical protein